MLRKILMVLVLSGPMLAGCASVPMTSPSEDLEAKQFTTDPGTAALYVNRGGGMGTAVLFQTVVDGRIVGSLAPNTYHRVSLLPGDHVLSVSGAENMKQEKLHAEIGRQYYYDVSVSLGWIAGRVALEPVSEAEGRRLVLKSNRAASVWSP